jgi:hypothetical protein
MFLKPTQDDCINHWMDLLLNKLRNINLFDLYFKLLRLSSTDWRTHWICKGCSKCYYSYWCADHKSQGANGALYKAVPYYDCIRSGANFIVLIRRKLEASLPAKCFSPLYIHFRHFIQCAIKSWSPFLFTACVYLHFSVFPNSLDCAPRIWLF